MNTVNTTVKQTSNINAQLVWAVNIHADDQPAFRALLAANPDNPLAAGLLAKVDQAVALPGNSF